MSSESGSPSDESKADEFDVLDSKKEPGEQMKSDPERKQQPRKRK